MVVSCSRIIAFELSHQKHKHVEVENFIEKTVRFLREKYPDDAAPILILDNSPKNRSRKIFKLARQQLFVPVFITPCCPEQNFIEGVFGILKSRLSKLSVLSQANNEAGGLFILAKAILRALASIDHKDFEKQRRVYAYEISFNPLFLP